MEKRGYLLIHFFSVSHVDAKVPHAVSQRVASCSSREMYFSHGSLSNLILHHAMKPAEAMALSQSVQRYMNPSLWSEHVSRLAVPNCHMYGPTGSFSIVPRHMAG